jgi:virginiamycin B lyase
MLRVFFVLVTITSLSLPTAFASDPDISEWFVPWEDSRPRDPYVAPDGTIWFVGQRSDYVANLDPQKGSFRQLPLDSGAGPHNVIVSKDGTLWYAGNRAAHIGKMDPVSGSIHKIMMPDTRARDPHTLTFDEDQKNIWFSVQGGNFIGKLNMQSEEVTLIEVPTQGSRPYGIEVHNGIVWVVLFGTNKIARIDAATMMLEEIVLPREETRPRRVAITPDGIVWYGDYAKGKLGRLDPVTRTITEWDMPSGERTQPYAMAADNKGRVWFVETGVDPNLFWGFDSNTNEFFSNQAVESGGGTIRHMVFDETRNQIWFGADTNTIGVADLPE